MHLNCQLENAKVSSNKMSSYGDILFKRNLTPNGCLRGIKNGIR